jgi:hypothetical protein
MSDDFRRALNRSWRSDPRVGKENDVGDSLLPADLLLTASTTGIGLQDRSNDTELEGG